jgi:hypothetical protein
MAASVLAFAACGYLPFMATKTPPRVEESPTATPTATPTPTATATPEVKKRKRRKRALHTPTPAPAGSPTPIGEGMPSGGAVITTGESAAERSEIQHSIEAVEGRLSAVKRDRLNAADAADYDRIQSFIADARSAMQEHDALRARSLMEKASRLASQLAGRVSNP